MEKNLITVSIVTYHNDEDKLKLVVDSVLNSFSGNSIYISDNSSVPYLNKFCIDNSLNYIFNNGNLGFGAAHNVAINKASQTDSKYHLILNPDVSFKSGTLEKLTNFLNTNPDIGLVMPKILYPTGEIQQLCKLLPTPFDWIFRRFLPFRSYIEKRNEKYELRFTGYNKQMEVPSLSGCFMLCQTSVLKEIGGFDERFFMYAEDVDLCRRIGQKSKTVYFPDVEIIHNYEKGSYKNKKLLGYHIQSAIKYFNKWGWFFDKERREINKETLIRLGYKSRS